MAKRIKNTRSPIEVRMLEALRSCCPAGVGLHDETHVRGMSFTFEGGPRYPDDYDDTTQLVYSDDGDGDALYLYADLAALTYRLDFLIYCNRWYSRPTWIAIECDGHDFHERTKQQAAYDRARDRELLGVGITTLRFTGSEIFHSAERCATEVYHLTRSMGRRVEIASIEAAHATAHANHMEKIVAACTGGEEHW